MMDNLSLCIFRLLMSMYPQKLITFSNFKVSFTAWLLPLMATIRISRTDMSLVAMSVLLME
jgi:hypothetical protein